MKFHSTESRLHLNFSLGSEKSKMLKNIKNGLQSEKSENPWSVTHLNNDLNTELIRLFKGEKSAFVQVSSKNYFLPIRFAKEGIKYYNFKPRSTDTWVVSFPRSGTTWTQEMVWLLGNDLDYDTGARKLLLERFPFLEFSSCVNEDIYQDFISNAKDEKTKKEVEKACRCILEDLERMTTSRYIKSHLPFSLLPPDLLTCGAKVIYVARNPKDVAASYFNFHQFIKTLDYVGDFKTFWNCFEQNLVLWAPYWDHVQEAWTQRNNPNLLLLFYEDLKKNLKDNIVKIAKFLGKQYSEEQIEKLAAHLDFINFQNNPSVNMESLRDLGLLIENDQKCIRQGKSGGWKNLFTDELNEQAEKWNQKNLESTDLKFPSYT